MASKLQVRRVSDGFKATFPTNGSSLISLTEYADKVIGAYLVDFVYKGEGKDKAAVGVKLRLFDATGEIASGTYRSVRVASQFTGPGDAIVGTVEEYGKGAVFNEATAAAMAPIEKVMVAALSE